ncbi:MAG: hypothetical protein KAW39_06190 [Thermoplasmata archaeon]|nr:hypothetical protein [Thermoplasmata archaeon]
MAKDTIIKARILKWGNSYGFRIQKADLERLGLRPGEEALVRLEGRSDAVDLSELPTFKGGMPDDSLRHDELLGEARHKAKKEKK